MATEQETFQQYRDAYLAFARGDIEASALPDRNDPIAEIARRSASEALMEESLGEDVAKDYYRLYGRINPETGALEVLNAAGEGFEPGSPTNTIALDGAGSSSPIDGDNLGVLNDNDGRSRDDRNMAPYEISETAEGQRAYFNGIVGVYAVDGIMRGLNEPSPTYRAPNQDDIESAVVEDMNTRNDIDISRDDLSSMGGKRHVYGNITERVGQAVRGDYKPLEATEPESEPEQERTYFTPSTPNSANGERLLSGYAETRGAFEAHVTEMQNALKAMGGDIDRYGPERDGVDGVWGPQTEAAFIAACNQMGLEPENVTPEAFLAQAAAHQAEQGSRVNVSEEMEVATTDGNDVAALTIGEGSITTNRTIDFGDGRDFAAITLEGGVTPTNIARDGNSVAITFGDGEDAKTITLENVEGVAFSGNGEEQAANNVPNLATKEIGGRD